MTTTPTPDLPLLRKALEWAEAEAAKPEQEREWNQNYWRLNPETAAEAELPAPACGTTYCLFGWVCYLAGEEWVSSASGGHLADGVHLDGVDVFTRAADLLGLDSATAGRLSHFANTIDDLRRIGEEIAASVGETL
ncbi:MAG: hypothetical protein ACRDP1_13270 [Nocardioidaceae bacterium]